MFIRYIASLIAGGAISLGLLVTVADLVVPAAATTADAAPIDAAPFDVFASPQVDLTAQVYDDGCQLPGGAYLEAPTPQPSTAAAPRPRRNGSTWWTAGPTRRVVSFPFRLLRRIRCQ